jgi:hypothetical protein
MSEHAPIGELPLFAQPASPTKGKRKSHAAGAAAASGHDEFLARLREAVAFYYGGTGLQITTDEVWLTMKRKKINLPAGASPNILGSFFKGWDRAVPVMGTNGQQRVTMSQRVIGNFLRMWIVR